MDLNTIDWEKDYNAFIDYLFSICDEQYQNFTFKLLNNSQIAMIGIRIPVLKKMAKMISKTDYMAFLKNNKHHYFEEIILHGFVVTDLKLSFKDSIILFEDYIKYIDNWSSCDSVIANYKLFSKNLDVGLTCIKKYLKDKNPWINRVGVVLLLDYYINDKYIDTIFELVDNIKTENYYVKMAIAWLLSVCLIKYYDKTINYLKITKLDDWTYNKVIQKAIESYRIKDKKTLRAMKR